MLQSSKERIQVDIDSELKDAVDVRLKQIGLTEKDLLSSFLMYVFRTRKIPFNKLNDREKAMAEAAKVFTLEDANKQIKELKSQADIDDWFDED